MSKHSGIRLLGKLISINSVFPKEKEIAKFCFDYLQSCGFEVRLQEYSEGRFNVIAQKGPRKGAILLTAHMDTVPPYNYGSRNPFSMQIKGDKIFGLGSWDMKAGLAILLECAKSCHVSSTGLRIVLTSDEENISQGTWAAYHSGEFSGCKIAICHEIPDASMPSSSNRPPIILGRRGRCVYKFKIQGIGGHGAAGGGVSAIDLSIKLSQAISKIRLPSSSKSKCSIFVRSFQSQSTSLSAPTEAILEVDAHYTQPFTKESFLGYIKKNLRALKFPKGCGWHASIAERQTPYLPAYQTDRLNPDVSRLLSAYKQEIGQYELSTGLTVADENIIAKQGVPVVTIGLKGGGAHSFQEWVSKKDFLLMHKKMPSIVQALLGR